MRADALDHLGADVAGGHLEDADGSAHGVATFRHWVAVGGAGLQFGGAAASTVGIELSCPLANRGEALELRGRQCGRVRIPLVRPDIDVLAELPDDLLAELLRLGFGPRGVLARRAADEDGEAHVGGGVVDGRDRGDGPVVDHAPTLCHRDAEAAVDRLDTALDVVDRLVFIAFEGDGEVDVGHRFVEVVSSEHRHDRRLVHELEMREVDAVFEHVLRMQFQSLLGTGWRAGSSRPRCCRRRSSRRRRARRRTAHAPRCRARCRPTRCVPRRGRCASGARGWADSRRGCRRCGPRDSTASRGTAHSMTSPSTWPPKPRWAPRCSQ